MRIGSVIYIVKLRNIECLEKKKKNIELAQGHGGDYYQHYDIHIIF